MARRRFQDPEPEVVGNWWQVRVYRDEYVNGRRVRKRKRIRLAPATMQVREVRSSRPSTYGRGIRASFRRVRQLPSRASFGVSTQ